MHHTTSNHYRWVPVIRYAKHYTQSVVCLYVLLSEHYGRVCPFSHIIKDVSERARANTMFRNILQFDVFYDCVHNCQ